MNIQCLYGKEQQLKTTFYLQFKQILLVTKIIKDKFIKTG